MTQQYLRKASLIIGEDGGKAIDLSSLRFQFDIRRGDMQTPNSARIRVYNVAPETANRVRDEFTRVVVQAGYEGNYGIVFDGTLIQARYGRENVTDSCLHLTCADGDRPYNFSVVSATLAAGSTTDDHVNVCLRSMENYGVGTGYIAPAVGKPLPRGKVMFGMAKDFLRLAAKTTSSVWSIQDGKLNMYPETAYIPGAIPKITPSSGLVGFPEQTRNGVSFRMLLNPSIKIGQIIELDNSTIQQYEYGLSRAEQVDNARIQQQNGLQGAGFYYVMRADHVGDTRGNAWHTEVLCIAADGTAIPTFQLENSSTMGVTAPVPNAIKSWV
ncbi:hypothetical protein BKK79_36125 [Cupriavidus sp. USMAA2-4]|uniref:phage protein n=1 Tax=Cupriavidus sp. USMAA2-4 TaxID=876364 RepID=UPI0008A6C5A6|nr:hypothetical protein [Cupriavidus sp. USMAA2-4]AOY96845.1 hypothetical protein BKK79_35720 [Cupriavidus sp. USMAA2-4]AOY96920.1 hypothetical protein BKK79_36125 [Cupriavidus sp. USMAA2-4]